MASLQIVPADKEVQAQYVEMKVPLYSYGCEKKVKKALSHLRGIHSVHVDYDLQKVIVWGICNKYDVLATIRKKRREARFWDQSEESVHHKTMGQYQITDQEVVEEEDVAAAAAAAAPVAKLTMKSSRLLWMPWKKKLFPI